MKARSDWLLNTGYSLLVNSEQRVQELFPKIF